MDFKIPFTFTSYNVLKKRRKIFLPLVKSRKRFKRLTGYLEDAGVEISKEEYLSICLYTFVFSFIALSTILSSLLFLMHTSLFYAYGLILGVIFSAFLFFSQLNYPRLYCFRKMRDIEKNLIPGLRDMLVQLTSGVPLFEIMVNISSEDYGLLSSEFKKAVKEISAGTPQINVLDKLGKKNSSVYFRRVLWQISNGMRSGSNMITVIKSSIDMLNKEQVLQIQNYGSRLNPLVMFYMLLSVILPALAITFLTVITSMIGLGEAIVVPIFIGMGALVLVMQFIFLGLIKTRRPSLI